MSKSTVTRIWIGGLVVLAAGLVLALGGVALMLAYGGTFTQVAGTNSYDFVPKVDGFFWTTIALIVSGGILAAVGGLTQLVAWIGALFNTYQITDRTWFAIVLAGGLLGMVTGLIGFATMLAYVVAGPDGLPHGRSEALPKTRPTLLPTS
ncbi:MAG TPA: hypothetical protein VEW68_00245 [Patescibacteria group bacterium]|nr:hypothetical protein [Patescibacteria group bacterium]